MVCFLTAARRNKSDPSMALSGQCLRQAFLQPSIIQVGNSKWFSTNPVQHYLLICYKSINTVSWFNHKPKFYTTVQKVLVPSLRPGYKMAQLEALLLEKRGFGFKSHLTLCLLGVYMLSLCMPLFSWLNQRTCLWYLVTLSGY